MKFKKGEKVRIKMGLKEHLSNVPSLDFCSEMEKYCGKVFKIYRVDNSEYRLNLKPSSEEWHWHESWLDKIPTRKLRFKDVLKVKK